MTGIEKQEFSTVAFEKLLLDRKSTHLSNGQGREISFRL